MILEWVRAVAGLVLILFIPGYTLIWAFYPRKEDMTAKERLAFSFPLSIAGVMLAVLFLDMGLGIDTTPINIVLGIVIMVLLSLLAWRVQVLMIDNGGLKRIVRDRTFEYRDRLAKIIELRRNA